jgi:hypothetical protein
VGPPSIRNPQSRNWLRLARHSRVRSDAARRFFAKRKDPEDTLLGFACLTLATSHLKLLRQLASFRTMASSAPKGARARDGNAGMTQGVSHPTDGTRQFFLSQVVGENGCLPKHRHTLQIHSSQLAIQLHEYHTQCDIVRQKNSGRFSEFLQAVPRGADKPLPGKELDKSDLALTRAATQNRYRQERSPWRYHPNRQFLRSREAAARRVGGRNGSEYNGGG